MQEVINVGEYQVTIEDNGNQLSVRLGGQVVKRISLTRQAHHFIQAISNNVVEYAVDPLNVERHRVNISTGKLIT